MSWNLLTRSIYGAESRLELVLSAPGPCSRELRRSVTCASTRESRRVLPTRFDATTCTSTRTSGHPNLATACCHHGRPIQGSQITICTNHSLVTHHRLLSRGTSSGHMAMTSMHNYIISPSPHTMVKVSYGTRFIMSSSIAPPPCRQFSAIVSSMCRAKKGGWFCQHMSSLCQQRRTYAKKGWSNCYCK